jgi:antitoxin component YwqK of YwqJK toxin-antitoxin module
MRTFYKLLLLLLPVLMVNCAREVILTDETLPDEIFYPEGTNTPYTGNCIVYYKNTKYIHYTFTFKKGILNGAFKSYFRNGKVEYSGKYYDGELVGEFTKYNENGSVALTYQFNDQRPR